MINEDMKYDKKEERQEALQKEFVADICDARCPDCNRPLATSLQFPIEGKTVELRSIVLVDGLVDRCSCGASHELLCPGCQKPLEYKENLDFCCPGCDMVFTLPSLPSDKFAVEVPVEMNFTR